MVPFKLGQDALKHGQKVVEARGGRHQLPLEERDIREPLQKLDEH